jgi:DHA1 family tetracycline resistance protein-like MFS transporter
MNNRRGLILILLMVTFDVAALGVMITVLPTIMKEFTAGDEASAAEMLGLFVTLWATMQFLFSPLIGALSDKYGRRPVLMVSCLGLTIDYVFVALAPSIAWLFIGRLVCGMTASTMSTARAYVADITPAEGRAKAFGLVGMAFSFGFVLGPTIGGMANAFDSRLPFWLAAAACLTNVLLAWLVLPESLPPTRRMAFSWKRGNPVGAVNLLLSRRQLLWMVLIFFLISMVSQLLPSVFVIYTEHRYGWPATTSGLTLTFIGASTAIVQGFLIGPTVSWLGPHRTVGVGLLFGAVAMMVYALAPGGSLFWLGTPLMALASLATPPLQAMMTRQVSASEQGQLQGTNNSARSLSAIIGPGIFAGSFAALMEPLPGAPFLVAAILMLIGIGVALLIREASPTEEKA